MNQTEFERLGATLLNLFPPLSGREQALSMQLYGLLAAGAPVPVAALGHDADFLRNWTDVRMDGEGSIIGYAGLTLAETQHRMRIGGRTLFTWCAWDTLFLPPLLGATAEIASTCPASGEALSLLVGPQGIARAPDGLLVSLIEPDPRRVAADLIGQFCCHVHFLVPGAATTQWAARRPGTRLASLSQAWGLGQRRNARRYARMAA